MTENDPETTGRQNGDSSPGAAQHASSGRRARVVVPGARPPDAAREEAAQPADEGVSSPAPARSDPVPAPAAGPLDESWQTFASGEAEELRERWRRLQGDFVDDPGGSVAAADALVEEVMALLTRRLSERRDALGRQWGAEGEDDTETLRQTVRGYRTMLHRILDTAP